MTKKYMEQRINLKFCVKLGKTYNEAHEMLKKAYGSNAMSKTQVFSWHKKFTEDFYDGIDIKQSASKTNIPEETVPSEEDTSSSDSDSTEPPSAKKMKQTKKNVKVIQLKPISNAAPGSVAELISKLVNKQIAKNHPVESSKKDKPL